MVLTKTTRRFSPSILAAALVPAFVSAAMHYISPTGSASWKQSLSANLPCSTAVAFANAVAGDTMYFRGGNYHTPKRNFGNTYSGYYNVAHSGNPNSSIVFMAFPSEVPLFIGTAGGSGDATTGSSTIYSTIFATNNQSYLVFDGFNFQSDAGATMARMMVGIDHTSVTVPQGHCIIKNCTFNGGARSNGSTDNNEGLRIEGNNFITVSNCLFTHYNNVDSNHNTSAIKTYWDTSVVINNCEFDSSTIGIYLKEANPKATVYNCFFRGNYEGFLISSEIMNQSESDSLTFFNNVLINSSYNGFEWEGAGSDSGTHGNDYSIYNNTFYGNVQNVVMGFTASGHGASFYNNISCGAKGIYNLVTDDFSAAWQNYLKQADHNNWGTPWIIMRIGDNGRDINYSSLSSWKSSGQLQNAFNAGCGMATNPGCGDLSANALFANGSGRFNQLADFILSANSPCKRAGRNGVDDIGAAIGSVGRLAISNFRLPNAPAAGIAIEIARADAREIDFEAVVDEAGIYSMTINDISGRTVWKRNLAFHDRFQKIVWNKFFKANGIYLAKLSRSDRQATIIFPVAR
jgi:hypothetical protein